MLRNVSSRVAPAVAALAIAVAACSFSADFFITKTFTDVKPTGASFSTTQAVDLAAEASGAWKRRDGLRSLDLVAVEAQVTRNYLHTTPTLTGDLYLVRAGSAGSPVHVGHYTHTLQASPTADAPDTFDVTIPESGSALIMDAIRDDGKFTVQASGTTTGNFEIDLKVVLHVGINYHVSP